MMTTTMLPSPTEAKTIVKKEENRWEGRKTGRGAIPKKTSFLARVYP
jgi:hypothetical protein